MNWSDEMLAFRKVCIWTMLFLGTALILTACESREAMQKKQDELLRSLGVSGPTDFAALSTCRQIEVYAIVGAKRDGKRNGGGAGL